jgi:hypothetical protein
MTTKYPEAQVQLVGEDGNAFSILARTMKALRKAGVPSDEVTAYHEEATAGDYGHLLRTTMAWVTCDIGMSEETETHDNDCHDCGDTTNIYADGLCEDCWDAQEDEEEN